MAFEWGFRESNKIKIVLRIFLFPMMSLYVHAFILFQPIFQYYTYFNQPCFKVKIVPLYRFGIFWHLKSSSTRNIPCITFSISVVYLPHWLLQVGSTCMYFVLYFNLSLPVTVTRPLQLGRHIFFVFVFPLFLL